MKILFIDHAFHKQTRSSDFFINILRDFFEVDVVYIDQTDYAGMIALQGSDNVDLVMLWQMDFLAPIFLARGLRTVVIPMYDGSSELPDLHWIWAKHARFLNFSRCLHERVRRLGATSLYVKYFVPAKQESSLPMFDGGLRVFLWQRRPELGINLGMIETLIGHQLTAVHIHDVPDDPELDTSKYLRRSLDGYRLTVSKWFDERSAYEKVLAHSNVFIGPRQAEGIGLGFIEAMARGMLVVLTDHPTHNEYVANWMNGVLFNVDHVDFTNFDSSAQVARLGWQTVREGHQRWLDSLPNLVAFLQSTSMPPHIEGIDPDLLSPREAQAALYQLKRLLEDSS